MPGHRTVSLLESSRRLGPQPHPSCLSSSSPCGLSCPCQRLHTVSLVQFFDIWHRGLRGKAAAKHWCVPAMQAFSVTNSAKQHAPVEMLVQVNALTRAEHNTFCRRHGAKPLHGLADAICCA